MWHLPYPSKIRRLEQLPALGRAVSEFPKRPWDAWGVEQWEKRMSEQFETATLGGGCFWCIEAVYQELQGVQRVVSGYAGGTVEHPTYEQVCSGRTGHAEVIQITFDPTVITFAELLEVFWRTHDPTTLNRQGPDVGTQYRSVIFYHDEQQRLLAEKSKQETEASGLWPRPIVTEITPLTHFCQAEAYHQDYYRQNPHQPYCFVMIDPKLRKLRKDFPEKLKESQRKRSFF
jgi:peptide-methionine (S)-S-oxide reductase